MYIQTHTNTHSGLRKYPKEIDVIWRGAEFDLKHEEFDLKHEARLIKYRRWDLEN